MVVSAREKHANIGKIIDTGQLGRMTSNGMTYPTIRYIALDFDNCICEINPAFHMVWEFTEKMLLHEELGEYYWNLRTLWIEEIDKALSDGKLHFLNDDVIMLLKHVHHGSLEVKPEVFVYTNNRSEELVNLVRDILAKNMKIVPWSKSFHPQDPRRKNEFPDLAPDEPGKSFEGVKACLGAPEDLTSETLLFLDDLLHPIRNDLGDRYIHIQPPFKSQDKLLPYLETLVKAIERMKEIPIAHCIEYRVQLKYFLHQKSTHLEYFPAPRDAYREWDLMHWNDYLNLFKPFGSYDDSEEYVRPSLSAYYKCRDFLTQTQDASAS